MSVPPSGACRARDGSCCIERVKAYEATRRIAAPLVPVKDRRVELHLGQLVDEISGAALRLRGGRIKPCLIATYSANTSVAGRRKTTSSKRKSTKTNRKTKKRRSLWARSKELS